MSVWHFECLGVILTLKEKQSAFNTFKTVKRNKQNVLLLTNTGPWFLVPLNLLIRHVLMLIPTITVHGVFSA